MRIAVAQIGSEESFFFRLHKRGAHGLEQDTSRARDRRRDLDSARRKVP